MDIKLTNIKLPCKQFTIKEKIRFILLLIFNKVIIFENITVHSLETITQNETKFDLPLSCTDCHPTIKISCKTQYNSRECKLKQKQRIIELAELAKGSK